MKILRNKAYRKLIAEKELTELSLKSLKSKYEFIVEENKRLHLKNDLLHIKLKESEKKVSLMEAQLSYYSEIEQKFEHKKRLESERKKRYEAKKKSLKNKAQ